jgi:hypothetical protein
MLLTSGQERDGKPGDDALSVLLMPVDAHGELVKLAGEIEIDVFDMALNSDQQRLGHWTFTTEDVREHWHKGLVSTGYLFRLDWQAPPVSPELTLHARMTVSDGRQFNATTQVKVDPPPRPPNRIAQVAHEAPGRASVARRPATPAARRTSSSSERAKVKPKTPRSDAGTAPPEAPAPRIRPSAGPGHADPPTQTSDKWTEEAIPTLR